MVPIQKSRKQFSRDIKKLAKCQEILRGWGVRGASARAPGGGPSPGVLALPLPAAGSPHAALAAAAACISALGMSAKFS